MTDAVTFTLDGREIEAKPGDTIWQLAGRDATRPDVGSSQWP